MNEYLLHVPGVSCGHCVNAISTAVGEVSGVETVGVDLDTKTVRVTGNVNVDDVCAAIDEAGYDVSR